MQFLPLLAALGLASAAAIEQRATPETDIKYYYLKSQVKAGQPKATHKFNNLYIEAYHTGAGLDDATFNKTTSTAAKGYLANPKTTRGLTFYNQLFDLGSTFPSDMVIDYTQVQYTSWQPVRINAGSGGNGTEVSGFFSTKEGLKWTSNPEEVGVPGRDAFGGWIVCDWWHGVPQLFVRTYNNTTPLPTSCANIDLKLEYATG